MNFFGSVSPGMIISFKLEQIALTSPEVFIKDTYTPSSFEKTLTSPNYFMIVALSPLDTNSVTFNGAHQKSLPSSSFTVLYWFKRHSVYMFPPIFTISSSLQPSSSFICFLQFSLFLHLFNSLPRFYFLHFIIQVFFHSMKFNSVHMNLEHKVFVDLSEWNIFVFHPVSSSNGTEVFFWIHGTLNW